MLLFAVSCQKDAKPRTDDQVLETGASWPQAAGSCRLTSYDYYDGIGDFHNIDYFSYKNGLVDYVIIYDGSKYVMEYNKQGKLVASKYYIEETLSYTIDFAYKNNRVVQETWRDAATGEIADDIFLTYNTLGNLIRNESASLDYYVDYTYNKDGSLESWKFFAGGLFGASGEYTYEKNIKNPFKSLAGMDYAFWYINSGFSIGNGQRWYTTEKVSLPDENGEPFVYYENDAAETVAHVGKQQYPLSVDYYDTNTELPIIASFEYENCEPGEISNPARVKQKAGGKNSNAKNRIPPAALKLLKRLQ